MKYELLWSCSGGIGGELRDERAQVGSYGLNANRGHGYCTRELGPRAERVHHAALQNVEIIFSKLAFLLIHSGVIQPTRLAVGLLRLSMPRFYLHLD